MLVPPVVLFAPDTRPTLQINVSKTVRPSFIPRFSRSMADWAAPTPPGALVFCLLNTNGSMLNVHLPLQLAGPYRAPLPQVKAFLQEMESSPLFDSCSNMDIGVRFVFKFPQRVFGAFSLLFPFFFSIRS